ncbi:SGNH hydrolase-type esterase domain-containing protein [Obelidium mucronatum]|nr:SGNH hydrolase-type esterase domain-containing protein [Obelidium mucronatum]
MLKSIAVHAWVLVLLSIACLIAFEVSISLSQGHHADKHRSLVADRPNPWGFEDPIVLVGDSLTSHSHNTADFGYGIRLESHFSRRRDILSRGFSGKTSDYVRPIFEQVLATTIGVGQSPSVLTLWLGTNDWNLGVPVDKYIQNMKEMAQHMQKHHPKTKVLFITPPPVLDDGGRVKARLFRDRLIQLGKQMRIDVLDTWVTFLGPDAKYDPSLSRYYVDNVHFNRLGHETFFHDIVKHL